MYPKPQKLVKQTSTGTAGAATQQREESKATGSALPLPQKFQDKSQCPLLVFDFISSHKIDGVKVRPLKSQGNLLSICRIFLLGVCVDIRCGGLVVGGLEPEVDHIEEIQAVQGFP